MIEKPDFLQGYTQESITFLANLPSPRAISKEGKPLEITPRNFSTSSTEHQGYELRAGFTKVADILATKETRTILWKGILSLQTIDHVVFDQLPHILYPNQTIPSSDLLKERAYCAYYYRNETEDNSRKLQLERPYDKKVYQNVIQDSDFLGGIGYKVKPYPYHQMGTYELGIADNSQENVFTPKQNIRLVVPSQVGCSPSILQFMISTLPEKALDTIDPLVSATAIEEYIQENSI